MLRPLMQALGLAHEKASSHSVQQLWQLKLCERGVHQEPRNKKPYTLALADAHGIEVQRERENKFEEKLQEIKYRQTGNTKKSGRKV